MEKEKAKKPVPAVAANKKPKASLRDYFKGIRTEVKKVVWPTRKELASFSGAVLFVCVVLSLGIWLFDSAFLASLKYALNISF
jgi:preprotein translocase subunit SecE